MINITNASKTYRNQVIFDKVNLSIKSNMLVSFVGPNGVGKSTLLKGISGITSFDDGVIQINDKTILNSSHTIDDICFFMNETILNPRLTGYEHLKLLGLNKRKANDNKWVQHFNISSFLGKKIKSYSLGMKQCLLIVMTLVTDRQILIFDESLNGLDPKNRKKVKNLLINLKKEKIILFSSHLLHDIQEISDQIILIQNKKLITITDISNENLEKLYVMLEGDEDNEEYFSI